MLDGRIDTQGTVEGLREEGILDTIAFDAAVDEHQEEMARSEAKGHETESPDVGTPETETSPNGASVPTAKKPRKLVKDEHRETGGVKWSIYKSYLKAS